MKKAKKATSNVTIAMTIGGETREIAEFDSRKLEIISYYLQQKSGNQNSMVNAIVEAVQKSFDAEIEKQYKKNVPAPVRSLYDNLIYSSSSFGGIAEIDDEN